MENKEIRIEMAKSVIAELGGYKAVRRIFPDISNAAICAWKARGLPVERERFLRATYPYLRIFSKYAFRCGAPK